MAELSFTCLCMCLQWQKSSVHSTGGPWASSTRPPSPLGSWSLMPSLTPSLTGGGCSSPSPFRAASSCSTTGKWAFVVPLPTTQNPSASAFQGLILREIWHCFSVVCSKKRQQKAEGNRAPQQLRLHCILACVLPWPLFKRKMTLKNTGGEWFSILYYLH